MSQSNALNKISLHAAKVALAAVPSPPKPHGLGYDIHEIARHGTIEIMNKVGLELTLEQAYFLREQVLSLLLDFERSVRSS